MNLSSKTSLTTCVYVPPAESPKEKRRALRDFKVVAGVVFKRMQTAKCNPIEMTALLVVYRETRNSNFGRTWQQARSTDVTERSKVEELASQLLVTPSVTLYLLASGELAQLKHHDGVDYASTITPTSEVIRNLSTAEIVRITKLLAKRMGLSGRLRYL